MLTGGTAVLASWVTSWGNARAAKVQAEATTRAGRQDRIRELRRAAYLELMEQAHLTGQLYWRVGDAYVQLSEHDAWLARIQELRNELRTAFDFMMRSCRIVVLEGPQAVAEAARAVQDSTQQANWALWRVALDDEDARERFNAAIEEFGRRLETLIQTAQGAMAMP